MLLRPGHGAKPLTRIRPESFAPVWWGTLPGEVTCQGHTAVGLDTQPEPAETSRRAPSDRPPSQFMPSDRRHARCQEMTSLQLRKNFSFFVSPRKALTVEVIAEFICFINSVLFIVLAIVNKSHHSSVFGLGRQQEGAD